MVIENNNLFTLREQCHSTLCVLPDATHYYLDIFMSFSLSCMYKRICIVRTYFRSRLSIVSENTNMNDLEELRRKQQQQKSSRGAKDRASTSSDTALAEGTRLKEKEKNAVGRTLSATYSERGSSSSSTKASKGKEPARTVPSIKITVF